MKTKAIFKTIFLLGVLTVIFPPLSSAIRGKSKTGVEKRSTDARQTINNKGEVKRGNLGELGKILEKKKVSHERISSLLKALKDYNKNQSSKLTEENVVQFTSKSKAGEKLLDSLTTSKNQVMGLVSIFSLFKAFDSKYLEKSETEKTTEFKNMEQLVSEIAKAIKNDTESNYILLDTTMKKSTEDKVLEVALAKYNENRPERKHITLEELKKRCKV